MRNEQMIEKILEWEGAPPRDPDGRTTCGFWSKCKFRNDPGSILATNVRTNDYWFDGEYQLALLPECVDVYNTNRSSRSLDLNYRFIARLPLTENRDELIAAVRMVMALEVNDRELVQT